jgi:signal transduction histidine kinase
VVRVRATSVSERQDASALPHQDLQPPSGKQPSGLADRERIAALIDEVSNRLQVILGYAQILHELEDEERRDAVVHGIEAECERLRETLRSLTGWTRDSDGHGPWE